MRQPISKNTNRLLWTVQGFLALLFLFAGTMKLALPLEQLSGPIALPGLFVRFIGVVEVLGGLGVILPRLLGVRPSLTPLAACGLVGVMTGATVLTIVGIGILPSIFPFVVGLLALTIVLGRGTPNAAATTR